MKLLFALFLVCAHKIRKPVSFILAKPYVRPSIDHVWDSCNVTYWPYCYFCVPFHLSTFISPNDTINGVLVGNKNINFC